MNNRHIIVLKFGSSVLRNESDLPTAVHEIYRWWRLGHQVIAVVSAFGNTTDQLTRQAHAACHDPDEALVAALLATGETASSALLGLALNRSGIPTTVLDAEQARLITTGSRLNADLVSVDATKVLAALQDGVVVLPGFVGRGRHGETTLLGRGGSDLTALFLSHGLDASCRLIKDVAGLYTSDPNSRDGQNAKRFIQVSYRTASRVGGAVVQLKAIDFAEKHGLRFGISSIGSGRVTEVGPHSDRIEIVEQKSRPLRVGLLGCGTVGGGVYQRLAALPELFEVVGVGTRNIERAIAEDIPVRLITTRLNNVVDEKVDVVIELLGGIEPAKSLITRALINGHNVITANKALLASEISELERLAACNGANLRYTAAVGGVTPALETVRQARTLGPLSSVSGVLNGTTNFVLDELAKGRTLFEALQLAQTLGYTEADPTFDIDGTDAAQKLILLARAAFDIDLPFQAIRRQGIESIDTDEIAAGSHFRLVAECRETGSGFEGSVSPAKLASHHPLAQVHGAGNCVLIEFADGRSWSVSGSGAGRWPTTEAVIADAFDLYSQASSISELDELEECVA